MQWKTILIRPMKRPNGTIVPLESMSIPMPCTDARIIEAVQTKFGYNMVWDSVLRRKRRERVPNLTAISAIKDGDYIIRIEEF